jgi:hypothetical protein
MTAFDPRLWEKARRVLGDPALPADSRNLHRDVRRHLAQTLRDEAWTFSEMEAALAIPRGTLHRWLTDENHSNDGGWLGTALGATAVGLLLMGGAILANRRNPPYRQRPGRTVPRAGANQNEKEQQREEEEGESKTN